MYEWFDKKCDDYREEQTIEERTSPHEIKKIFCNNFYKSFFATIIKLLFKFMIEKGDGHIEEAEPPIYLGGSTKWEQ